MMPYSNPNMMNVSPDMVNAKPGMSNVSPMGGDIKSLCQRYMNYHVIAQTIHGQQFDGIIDGVDDEGITMLVAEEVDDEVRQFIPYGRRRFRRFRRQRFLFPFLFTFLIPFPYYYPTYPYYY